MKNRPALLVSVVFLFLFAWASRAGAGEIRLLQPTALTRAGGFLGARMAPGSGLIACSREGFDRLYLIEPGSAPRELLADELSGYGFAWAPDGRRLYVRVRRDGAMRILTVDLNGRATPLGPAYRRLSLPLVRGGWVQALARGEDRPRTLVEGLRRRPEVHFVAARDDRIVVWTRSGMQTVSDAEDRYFNPRLSPDGRRVCFEGLVTGLHVVDLRSGEHRRLGPGNEPAWAPDSRHIVFALPLDDSERITASELYLADAETGAITPLTATPGRLERRPSVTPDGRELLFDAGGVIYRAPLDPPFASLSEAGAGGEVAP
jgi:Tol biopolymer transport system component